MLNDTDRPGRFRVLALLTLLVASVGGWIAVSAEGEGPLQWLPSRRMPTFSAKAWTWRSEEHWVVDQSTRDVGEMLCFAAGERPEAYTFTVEPTNGQAHAYRIRVEGPKLKPALELPLVIYRFLWDPEDYAPFAHALKAALGVPSGPAQSGLETDTLQRLLTPDTLPLETTQRMVSEALTRAPNSAEAHGAAAATLAAFGLFQDSGDYLDHRPVLSRLSAHLVVARELESGATGAGAQVGQVALQVLTGRSAPAVAALEALRANGGLRPSEAWMNVLYMRATGDWRGVADPERATLAEVMASFATRGIHQNPETATDWVAKALHGRSPDFMHHAAYHWLTGVTMGHRITGSALDQHLAHIQEVQAARKLIIPQSTKAWCEPLNARPGRAFNATTRALEVIDWGMWARRFQGELLEDMERRVVFLMDMYGVREEGESYLDQLEREYAGLEQFPLLQRRCGKYRPKAANGAMPRLAKLLQDHPESVSDTNFVCLSRPGEGGGPALAAPRYSQWLAVPVPFGTAYNLGNRCWEMTEWYQGGHEGLGPYRALRPYDLWLAKNYIKARFRDGSPTPEVAEEVYGPLKGFAPQHYLEWVGSAFPEGSPEHMKMVAQLAEIEPSEFHALGDLLLNQGKEDEALKAYLKAYSLDRDRVRVSNNMLQAVLLLHRLKRDAEAEGIARDCGNSYSHRGLATLAVFLELQGRYAEAEQEYEKIKERYGSTKEAAALGLYMRCADRDPGLKLKRNAALRALFPNGVQRFDSAKAPVPPQRGVQLETYPSWAVQKGLAQGAIIVAIDGQQVENQEQYIALRDTSLEASLNLVVFQGGRYTNLHLWVPGHRFGVKLIDYRTR